MNAFGTGILQWSIYLSFMLLMVSLVLSFIRFLGGPSLPDRIVAFDLVVIILMGIIILFSIMVNEIVFLDAVIVMALIAFLGTVAYAKYLEKGVRL